MKFCTLPLACIKSPLFVSPVSLSAVCELDINESLLHHISLQGVMQQQAHPTNLAVCISSSFQFPVSPN